MIQKIQERVRGRWLMVLFTCGCYLSVYSLVRYQLRSAVYEQAEHGAAIIKDGMETGRDWGRRNIMFPEPRTAMLTSDAMIKMLYSEDGLLCYTDGDMDGTLPSMEKDDLEKAAKSGGAFTWHPVSGLDEAAAVVPVPGGYAMAALPLRRYGVQINVLLKWLSLFMLASLAAILWVWQKADAATLAFRNIQVARFAIAGSYTVCAAVLIFAPLWHSTETDVTEIFFLFFVCLLFSLFRRAARWERIIYGLSLVGGTLYILVFLMFHELAPLF